MHFPRHPGVEGIRGEFRFNFHGNSRWERGIGEGGQAADVVLHVELAEVLQAAVQQVLQSKRDAYYAIATANSGTVKNDSAIDIEDFLPRIAGDPARLWEWIDRARAENLGLRANRDDATNLDPRHPRTRVHRGAADAARA